MAKLIVVALAFTAVVLFASARATDNPTTSYDDEQEEKCRRQLQEESFNQCQMYILQQGHMMSPISYDNQDQVLEQCCQQLRKIQQFHCRCDAVKQVFRHVIQQQQQHFGGQQIQQMKEKAQDLTNICKKGRILLPKCKITLTLDTYNNHHIKQTFKGTISHKNYKFQ